MYTNIAMNNRTTIRKVVGGFNREKGKVTQDEAKNLAEAVIELDHVIETTLNIAKRSAVGHDAECPCALCLVILKLSN